MSDISLEINGTIYEGWKSMTVSRSVESITDSFSLEVADYGSDWPIAEEDECRVLIDGEQVLNGWVERPTPSFDARGTSLRVSGYGRPSVLAQCSVVPDDGRWSFKNATVKTIAEIVSNPFGVRVFVQAGLELIKAPRKLVINPGDTAFDVIVAAASASGVLVVSRPDGNILITRSGTERTHDALIQGFNIAGGTGEYDASIRYHRYVVFGQSSGTDQWAANATRLRAEAFDDGVARKDRVLIIRSEAAHNAQYNSQRGDWEARNRAAAAQAASITVHGWKQSNGALWPVNAIVKVVCSKLRIRRDMLISQVDFSKDAQSGEVAILRVVRPDAFEPDPTARVKK